MSARDRSRSPRGARLAGKVAMVTGSSSGIGQAIAKALAAEGATVVLCARRKELLDKTKDEIVGKGGKAIAAVCDVTKRESVHTTVQEAEKEAGKPIDILVNVAGVMYFSLQRRQDLCAGLVQGPPRGSRWDRRQGDRHSTR
eukprot:TRINITY_DN1484_c0_g1_i1.p1 TRINITY_DN1484_c0_g1~~TRINITY_DN1484_c0_g1_i1.p1  ORF type:complete len:142 (+),score=21.09 TRINITY_DN1484_c0_g1_i1:118-543(+)